jgi:putative transport protein
MEWIFLTLQRYPELAIFLSLAIGYWVGVIKFGSFSLGTVTGTLLAALVIGQIGITVSPHVKSVFFIMFLFAVGYGVGPQFVRGIATDGLPQAIFAVAISVLCLACVYVAAVFVGYDAGFGAGLLAGAQTISASMGVATDAINNLGLPADQASELINHIPVAYAVTYIWGTIGTGVILAMLGPKLLGVDLAAECQRYEKELSAGGPEGGMQSAYRRYDMRAYKIGDGIPPGTRVADAESYHTDVRVFIERLRREGQIIPFEPTTVLKPGDVIAVSGRTEVLVERLGKYSTEVSDPELLDVPAEAVDVVLTNKAYNGKTLVDLAKTDFARGVYLTKITRGATSVNIPVLAQTKVYRGDILRIVGTRTHTDAAVKNLGYADRPTTATDMVFVGLGIVLGGLVGALTVRVSGIPITLSTSGGALIAGIIIGWLRGVHPTFGRVPAPALWFMNSVGLNVFIAIVGITAGPTFIAGLKQAGIGLFVWGVFATSVPMLLAPLIGKYIFKFDPAINLGCCGGARTSTASVAMVGEVAKSDIPMLGYTVPYAVSNTLLTMWGLVIVLMLS